MFLAIKKEEGSIKGAGFHFMMHPFRMNGREQVDIYKLMGYHIVQVPDERGEKLLEDAKVALSHQVEVAFLVDGPEQDGVTRG